MIGPYEPGLDGPLVARPTRLEPHQSRIARERAASPLVQARHRIGLPEREGVGER